jgi:hypothetical protein
MGDPSTLALVGVVAVQALDLLGHLVNHRKLRRAELRLEEAEARGKRIEEALSGRPASGLLRGDVDPREAVAAREERADAAAALEVELLAEATATLGDTWGPAVIEWVRVNAPAPWKRAMKNPSAARAILRPAFALAERVVSAQRDAQEAQGGAGDSPFNPRYGR